jgi:glycerate 2-kinase
MSLREHAEAIWRAGVAAVDSIAAVRRHISCDGTTLRIADVSLALSQIGRIEILGAGKAGAGMAAGAESALLEHLPASQISGWVNVPADCVRPLQRIHLHAARPAGINEPTSDGVEGTNEILRRISNLQQNDACLVLLSGGASALLCSPVPQISLADKLAVTRALASSGAPIQELNLVRTQLSQVKGGRLAAACTAGTLIALIISDVIGDPLEVIGSGPTTPAPSRADQAIEILNRRQLLQSIPPGVLSFLESRLRATAESATTTAVRNVIVASNRIAMEAAAARARELGYQVESLGSDNAGAAAVEGRELMQKLLAARSVGKDSHSKVPLCILSGGEPTVDLRNTTAAISPAKTAPLASAKGGRNQELVLAAIDQNPNPADWNGIVLLSGGTDGEDGPTDAAGAVADEELVGQMVLQKTDYSASLAAHDSYHFFEALDGLLKTGPTHTNVMDLRVGLVTF